MLVLALSVLIIFALIGAFKEKSILNIQSIFCLMWAMICWLASLRLFDMVAFSDRPYLVISIGCVSFSFGYWAYIRKKRIVKVGERDSYSLNLRIYNGLYYISIVLLFILAIRVIGLLQMGVPYSVIRDLYGEIGESNSLLQSKAEIFINTFILVALVPVFNAFLILHFFNYLKLSKKQIIQIVLLAVLYCFVTGSRIVITNLIFQALILVMTFRIKIPMKEVRKVAVVGVVLYFAISFISENRQKDHALVDWGTKETYYAYSSLAVPMLDHYLTIADRTNFMTYGMTTVYGVCRVILLPYLVAGGAYPDFFLYTESFFKQIDEYIPIFYGVQHNAFVSIFLYFYLDFGYVGVILGCFLYGFLFRYFIVRAYNKRDVYSILIFLIFVISLAKCFARWEFVNAGYVLAFIYIPFLLKKNKKYERS
ncbi:O-antigen polymerase [Sphingobacterium sp. LRF_L2]|uniref:O-antigen polymerase n=1 Tax=Sphingobacterium sp. LRF_L2 TaxID=3369421 RepID=UPI003F5E7897